MTAEPVPSPRRPPPVMSHAIVQLAKQVLPASMWGVLRSARREVEQRLFRRYVARHRYGHVSLQVQIADPLGKGWYDRDWDAMPEVELLRQHGLRPGATVFDLGAHHGVVALVLADIVGRSGRVVALEADPHNVEVARENARLNPAYPVRVVHAAISDTSGELLFTHNGHVGDDSESGMRVRCMTIDELAAEHGRPDVLFIDVEGFECQALRGAAATLASRPDCYVEVHVGEGLERFGSVDEVLAHFPDETYAKWVADLDAGQGFVPYAPDLPLLARRFMLVAIARRD
jgi:FkbM family methyltransferase